MKIETPVRQQYKDDKAYFTGQYGMGYLIINAKTGEAVATAPTLEQAEQNLAKAQAKHPEIAYRIEDAGKSDSAYHKEDSPFRFKPL